MSSKSPCPVSLSPEVSTRYSSLPLPPSSLMAEYIWLGGTGHDLRSKSRTIWTEVKSVEDLPIWNFDGSSTGQATGKDSEIYLKPVKIYKDPFRLGNNILVLCETCLPDNKLTPISTNSRRACSAIMDKAASHHPWFGLEQEYSLLDGHGKAPLGWPEHGFPRPQGPYYCGIGTNNAIGRPIVEAHYRACLYAGLKIGGVNAEVKASQWEYQIGPCEGVEAGDQLWVARYIMERVCEDFGVTVTLDPKPVKGDWNGAGCHCNYSTEEIRKAPGGYDEIIKAIEKMGKKHLEHIAVYGEGNERRLTGHHETAPIHQFSYGLANRGASVRIPRQAKLDDCGYFEDRRPAANMDPYAVTAKIVQTTVLE